MRPTIRITLLDEIREGSDAGAWRAFVDLYAPLIYGYCRQQGLQHADCENVAEEVFRRVSQAIRALECNVRPDRFRSWLGRILHEQMLQCRRRAGHALSADNGRNAPLDDFFPAEAEGLWTEAFNAHVYAHALATVQAEFDDRSWRAFERLWEGEERPAEIARELRTELARIYQWKHQALSRLKEEIERLASDVTELNRS